MKVNGYDHDVYQYGYVDFTPWSDAQHNKSSAGPTRKCAYDDICYYLSHMTPESREISPQIPALVVKQLALSHTIALTEFLKAQISTIEEHMRSTWGGIEQFAWLESTVNELFGWNRRLSEYCEHTEAALNGLRISHNGEIDNREGYDRWTSCDEDFRRVYRRMVNLKNRNHELITSANGLIGLVQARRSAEAAAASLNATRASQAAADASAKAAEASLIEERAVRALTIVGMLYLPLGFTSGLFSIGQDYGPGQARFWVYWVVSVPLVFLAYIGYTIVVKNVTFRSPREGTTVDSGN